MKLIVSGLFAFIISCSGIYCGCEKKYSEAELAKTQGYTNERTKQSAATNVAVPGQSRKKVWAIRHRPQRIVVTYYYGDAVSDDSLEIKDEAGVSYFRETYSNDDESFYAVESVFKLEGKSGEGIIIFNDEGPSPRPAARISDFGMRSGSLKALSPRIGVCGAIEKLPKGTPRGVLKL